MMVVDVDVTADGAPIAGRPRLLFERRYVMTIPTRAYDPAPDGRFVMVFYPELDPLPVTQINLVQNWLEELKRLVPTGQ